ncbi:MAG: substrate-binding domain-containing protein [Bacteroidetes bacterium]|nr:substrate-binding domain-containing protein [Bacteroidota bacterium]
MSRLKIFVACIGISLIFVNCRNKVDKYDSPIKGKIFISVDESFKPVITEEIKVYESSHPGTQIVASYKPEVDCFKDLEKDSTRLIIVSRGLSEDENEYYKQKLSYKARWENLAYDAIAVIVNIHAKDSLFTIEQLRNYLGGKDSSKLVVLDGTNATSTVRTLKDSLLDGGEFGKNVRAATNSKQLLSFVASNINAIGFIGLSWVGDEDDPEQLKYWDSIRYGLVECKRCGQGVFSKPSQATISAGEYTLYRPLYYILKENTTGLGTGFVTFLGLEQGQLIFRRSYLVPAKMNFSVRKTLMQSNSNLLNKKID